MRREGFAEHLSHFEVLADRELMAGFPTVVRLHIRGVEAVLATLEGTGKVPYDARFAKAVVKAALHLLTQAPGVSYGFAEHDEISVLLSTKQPRDAKNLLVTLVAEGSAKLSLLLSTVVTLAAKIYEFPNPQLALEYFRWRQEQVRQRALDQYCAYVLSKTKGLGDGKAIGAMAEADKLETLRRGEIHFEGLPDWQCRGTGVYVNRANGASGHDNSQGSAQVSPRLVVDPHLPSADGYTDFLKRFFPTI